MATSRCGGTRVLLGAVLLGGFLCTGCVAVRARGGVVAVPKAGVRASGGGGVSVYERMGSNTSPTKLFGVHADVMGGANHVWLRAGPEVIVDMDDEFWGIRGRPEFGLLAASSDDSADLEPGFYTGLNVAPRVQLPLFYMLALEADVSGGIRIAGGDALPAMHLGASLELALHFLAPSFWR